MQRPQNFSKSPERQCETAEKQNVHNSPYFWSLKPSIFSFLAGLRCFRAPRAPALRHPGKRNFCQRSNPLVQIAIQTDKLDPNEPPGDEQRNSRVWDTSPLHAPGASPIWKTKVSGDLEAQPANQSPVSEVGPGLGRATGSQPGCAPQIYEHRGLSIFLVLFFAVRPQDFAPIGFENAWRISLFLDPLCGAGPSVVQDFFKGCARFFFQGIRL